MGSEHKTSTTTPDGPLEKDGTLGSGATMHEQPTHPDRSTGKGALGAQPPGKPKKAEAGTDAVVQPNRDDVHEQRTDDQPREGTVTSPLPRRARPTP
jgi:hypothetical protein